MPSDAMVKSISLKNWKTFKDTTLELGQSTLLCGPPCSGKTNAVEAIRLLKWLAEGRRFDHLIGVMQDPQYRRELNLRGSFSEVFGLRGIELGCTVPGKKKREVTWNICVGAGEDSLHVAAESLNVRGKGVPLFETRTEPSGLAGKVDVVWNVKTVGTVAADDSRTVLSQLSGALSAGRDMRRALDNVLFCGLAPERMRESRTKKDLWRFREDGANLAAMLYRLCVVERRKDEVLTFLQSFPERHISDINFVEDAHDVNLSIVEQFGNTRIVSSAGMVSDSTLRLLGIAAAMLSAPAHALLVIDDVCTGFSPPNECRRLLEVICSTAAKRDAQVLLTTQMPVEDVLPLLQVECDILGCARESYDARSRIQFRRAFGDYRLDRA